MTARLLVLIARIKYYFQCFESTFYTGKSILIQAGGISETVDKLCLLVLCYWGISKCSARLFWNANHTKGVYHLFQPLLVQWKSKVMCFPQICEAVEFAISLYVVKNSSQPIRTFRWSFSCKPVSWVVLHVTKTVLVVKEPSALVW